LAVAKEAHGKALHDLMSLLGLQYPQSPPW
jgi:hypothetical protein